MLSHWLSNISSQSGLERAKHSPFGKGQTSLMASLRALAFVQQTVAWCASLGSLPQILQMLSCSKVLFILFSFVGTKSVAALQAKILTLWGMCAFHEVPDRLPSLAMATRCFFPACTIFQAQPQFVCASHRKDAILFMIPRQKIIDRP